MIFKAARTFCPGRIPIFKAALEHEWTCAARASSIVATPVTFIAVSLNLLAADRFKYPHMT